MSRSEIAQGVGIFLFFGLMINGCVHSCKKHKDDPGWLQNTPAVVYRGLEFFWHDDFAGVNWNDRLKSDVRSAFVLINLYNSEQKVDEVSSEIEAFSKKINEYPKDKLLYIKKAVQIYFRFQNDFVRITGQYLDSIISGNYLSVPHKWNLGFKPTLDSIVTIYNYPALKEEMETVDSAMTMMALKAGFAEYDDAKERKISLDHNSKIYRRNHNQVYIAIFKENYE